MKKIWIVGSSGHVGSALNKILNAWEYEIIMTDKDEVDIADEKQVGTYIRCNRPDVIINCAGCTNPAFCEENVEEAYKVNAVGVRNIAQEAESIHAKLIQLSTDDVFDLQSDRPYNEFDEVHPKNIYGKSKYAGELFVKQLMTRYVIIRSSWIYGIGKDFVDEVLTAADDDSIKKMEVNVNRYAVPTSAKELAKTIKEFIDHDHYGTYHAVCQGGGCSRFEYAREVLKMAGKEDRLELHPIVADEEHKSQYSVLDNMMLRITGLEEPKNWKEALKEYMEESGGRVDGRN